MKNLILILTLCVMAKVSFAEPTNPNLNSDLDFRFDSQYSESESERGVANAKPEIEVDKGDPVPSMDKKGNVRVISPLMKKFLKKLMIVVFNTGNTKFQEISYKLAIS